MTAISWASGASGDWSLNTNWNPQNEPGSGDDATIGVGGSYTVTLTTAVTVGSITLSDANADLAIEDPGATEAVTGNLTNSGALLVDAFYSGQGGTQLTVDGTLTNSNTFNIGASNETLSASDTVTVGGLVNTGGINL